MSFFESLRKKLNREPDRLFDQRFWAKFDAERGTLSPSRKWRIRFWRWASPTTLAVALAAAVVFGWGRRATHLVEEQARQAEVLLDEDIMDELEMLATIEEHKLHELDEDDWDQLLAEEEHAL